MQLALKYTQSETKDGLYAYALHVEAKPLLDNEDSSEDSSEALDPEIFVFRRSTPTMNPFGPTDRMVDDEFFNVATPVDMYDVPAKHPDIEHGMPYFRDSRLDLWFRNLEDLLRAKKEISEDVASLVKLWDNVSNVESSKHEETVIY